MNRKDEWYLPPHLRAINFGITFLSGIILGSINDRGLLVFVIPIHIVGAVILRSVYRESQVDPNAPFYELDRIRGIGQMLELVERTSDDKVRKKAIRRLIGAMELMGPEHKDQLSARQHSILLRTMTEYRFYFPLFSIAALGALEKMKDVGAIDAVRDVLDTGTSGRSVQKSVRVAAERCLRELEKQRMLAVQSSTLLRPTEPISQADSDLLRPVTTQPVQDETLLLRPSISHQPEE